MDPRIYYSRKDIQESILFSAKDREFSARYEDGGFGKRPGIVQFEQDIQELAQQGASSFHISEELWYNPLDLEVGMPLSKVYELRKGWDLLLDIDCIEFEYSRITAYLLIEAIQFHDINCISLKFSGNKGMHIGLPFKTFPKEFNTQKIERLFPDAARVIAGYLGQMIKEALAAKILDFEHGSLELIEQKVGKKSSEFLVNGKFDPFKIIEIDTILISNRHMFRAPYSLHEKSGLVSLPIQPEKILSFRKEEATPETVIPTLRFLDDSLALEGEATQLFIQAFDWHNKQQPQEETRRELSYEEVKDEIPEEYFPPCIKLLLSGIQEDGRKRALFILINFLSKVGYHPDKVDTLIHAWNAKNTQPLKEGYIRTQLSWYKRQALGLLPPNCNHSAYYTSMLVCKPDGFCPKIKNPAHYAIKKQRMINLNKSSKKKNKKGN